MNGITENKSCLGRFFIWSERISLGCIILAVFVLNLLLAPFVGFCQEIVTDKQEKISFDIKGMDIVDVLKTLSSRSGLNIVVGKNVTGKVTLFLKDVDIWDAFEIVLSANDLAYEKKGNIINVMTQRDYELKYGERQEDKKQMENIHLKYAKAADLARSLTQIKSAVGKVIVDEASNTIVLIDSREKLKDMQEFVKKTDLPLSTQIFSLNYAQADKVSAKLQDELTKGVGLLKIDERTNKIAITDYPEKLAAVSRLINAFDERTFQVLIDAQIIEIKPSQKLEIGVDWDYWIDKNFRLAVSLPTSGSANKLSVGTAASGNLVSEKGEYKGIIDLLRTLGDTKILSSPRIISVNNQEAKILVGTKEAYAQQTTVTGEGGAITTSETINFVDVGIKLYVTPTVNREGFITMKIKPEISSVGSEHVTSKGEHIPIIATSEAETSVMVKDGVTIIIGGLRKDEKHKSVKKVPFLGDIPLLGHLFRNTSEELKKTELVILLTPHIISGEESYTDLAQLRPEKGVVVRMENGNIITENTPAKKHEITLADNLPILDYNQMLSTKINEQIKRASVKGLNGEVVVRFKVAQNGSLTGQPEIISASEDSLGIDAIEAIKKAAPFPPLNESVAERSFQIAIEYK